MDMKLEVVTLPVSDVDRAKSFYESLGWRFDIDLVVSDDVRTVQFTPPHSQCSIQFGKAGTAAEPGSADGLILVVEDIDAARDDLIGRGVEVSEVQEARPPGQFVAVRTLAHRSPSWRMRSPSRLTAQSAPVGSSQTERTDSNGRPLTVSSISRICGRKRSSPPPPVPTQRLPSRSSMRHVMIGCEVVTGLIAEPS